MHEKTHMPCAHACVCVCVIKCHWKKVREIDCEREIASIYGGEKCVKDQMVCRGRGRRERV